MKIRIIFLLLLVGALTTESWGKKLRLPEAEPTTLISGSVTYLVKVEPLRQVGGADPITHLTRTDDPQWEGYLSDHYMVEASSSTIVSGSSFIVHYKPTTVSNQESLKPEQWGQWKSFTCGNVKDNDWFYGLYGKYLLIDQGCCPEPRDLEIIDLETKKVVHHDSYSRPVYIKKDVLIYWEDTKEKATPGNCPDYAHNLAGGPGGGIDEKVEFDFKSLRLRHTGEKRCSFRQ